VLEVLGGKLRVSTEVAGSGDISITGSRLAGRDVQIFAGGDVSLLAGQDQASQHSYTSIGAIMTVSAGFAGVSASLGVGAGTSASHNPLTMLAISKLNGYKR
jgi:hypothetical protein